MARGLLDDEELRRFNATERGEQPWYAKALPMEGRATFLPFRDTMEGSVFNKRELAVPGLLAEVMNAFTAPGRSLLGTDPEFSAGKEGVNMAMNVMGGGLGTSRAMRNPTGQGGVDLAMNAWHGSPYDIQGKFDINKVGTGEGAQAYGHGMYFAEARPVAEGYAKDISRSKLMKGGDPQVLDQKVGNQLLTEFYEGIQRKADRLPVDKAQVEYEKLSFLEDLMQGTTFKQALSRVDDPAVEAWAKTIEPKYKAAGNLYRVDIPDEQIPKMLNWDEPLNKQPQAVKDAFSKLGISVDEKANKAFLDDLEAQLTGGAVKGVKEVPNPTGEKLYNRLVNKFGSPEAASQELNKLGVTGIRYLDEQSRGKDLEWVIKSPQGGENVFRTKETADAFLKKNPEYTMIEPKALTSNFVVFDPATVKILQKNDIDIEELLKNGLIGN